MQKPVDLPASSLLPPRLADTALASRPRFRDALALPGGAVLSVFQTHGEVVVAPLVPEAGGVRRAVPGDGAFAGVLAAIRGGVGAGRFQVHRWNDVPPGDVETAIDVDQSNDSVVVGTAVVKVYVKTAPGPQPGLDLPAHLAAVGFAETPTPFGVITWRDEHDRPTLVASACRFLPGARDGWQWWVDLVEDAATTGRWAPATEPADAVGGLVARLHRALATPSDVIGTPLGGTDASSWLPGAEATLREALALTDGEAGLRLAELAPAARRAFAVFGDAGPTPTMRIHGDLHVGQILAWDGGYAVADFDGNPLADAATRVAPGSPARDVASMARAIDHVGRVVARRRPPAVGEIERWIQEARTRFLAAYREGLGDVSEVFDERLLHPFEVVQECHEYVYAARYLPRWRGVPEAAMPALLGGGA